MAHTLIKRRTRPRLARKGVHTKILKIAEHGTHARAVVSAAHIQVYIGRDWHTREGRRRSKIQGTVHTTFAAQYATQPFHLTDDVGLLIHVQGVVRSKLTVMGKSPV